MALELGQWDTFRSKSAVVWVGDSGTQGQGCRRAERFQSSEWFENALYGL